MFVFAGLSFCSSSSRRREIKLPTKEEVEKSQVSGLPKTFIYLEGRETQKAQLPPRARRETSAFNEAVKTEIKQSRGGGSVLCFICTGIWYTYAQADTGRAVPGLSPHGTRAERGPGALPPSVPLQRGARGTVVHLFPKEKNRPNPPPKHAHTH